MRCIEAEKVRLWKQCIGLARTNLLAGLEVSGTRKTWREAGCLAAGEGPTACVQRFLYDAGVGSSKALS